MKADARVRALESCLQQIQAGCSLEEALAAYPEYSQEMRPILEASQALIALGTDVRQEASRPAVRRMQARDKVRFMQAAQALEARSKKSLWSLPLRFGMGLAFILILVIFSAVRTVAASSRALPGEALYPIKLASEHARLLLASTQSERLELERNFDRERTDEVEALLLKTGELGNSGRSQEVRFVGGLGDMDADGWHVDGIKVLVSPDARLVGDIFPGVYVEVSGVLQPNGTVLARQIQVRLFEIGGHLERVAGAQWWVDNIPVRVTPDTIITGYAGKLPPIGTLMEVEALLANDGTLLARVVEVVGQSPDQDVDDDTAVPLVTETPAQPVIQNRPPETQPASPGVLPTAVLPASVIPGDETLPGVLLPQLKPDGGGASQGYQNEPGDGDESLEDSEQEDQDHTDEDSQVGSSGGDDTHFENDDDHGDEGSGDDQEGSDGDQDHGEDGEGSDHDGSSQAQGYHPNEHPLRDTNPCQE